MRARLIHGNTEFPIRPSVGENAILLRSIILFRAYTNASYTTMHLMHSIVLYFANNLTFNSRDAGDLARERRHAPSSVHALNISLAPALSRMHIQVPRKALTIECLARKRPHARDWQRASNLLIERPAIDSNYGTLYTSCRSVSTSTTDTEKKESKSDVKDDIKQGNGTLQPCSLMVDMDEDYMEDYQMEEGEDTDEFEDIENEDENDPDDLFERTLEVRKFCFYCMIFIQGKTFSFTVLQCTLFKIKTSKRKETI